MSSKTPDYSKSAEIEAQGYRDAAKIQAASDAENRALQEKLYNKQLDQLNQTENYNREQVADNKNNWKPYVQAGQGALAELQNIYQDPNSYLNKQYTGQDLENDAGYQFRKEQGQSALYNSLAARNGVLGGAANQALIDYNQGFASNEFQNGYARDQQAKSDRYNALIATLNTGITGTSGYQSSSTPSTIGSQLAAVTGNYGDTMGSLISNAGNNQANSVINTAQSAANYNTLAQNASAAGSGRLLQSASGAIAGGAAGFLMGGPAGAAAGAVGGAVMGYGGGSAQAAGQAGQGLGSMFANKTTQTTKM